MAVEHKTTSNVRYIGGDDTADGTSFGHDASSKISFYGATPTVRLTGSSQGAVTITATTALTAATISQVATSGKWAFASSTVAQAYVARVKQLQVDIEAVGVLLNKLRADLVTVGMIKGAA